MYIDTNEATMTNECTLSAGHFDGHGGALERYRRYRPMWYVQGYSGSYWTPASGIGRLLAPYHPSGHQGNRQTNNNQQMHLKRWPNWWPWRCAGTEPPTSPNDGGLGLCKMPQNTTIGQVLRPIEGNEKKNAVFFRVFSSLTNWKGARGDVKVPDNNRGMT
jgi:hypothetical protein